MSKANRCIIDGSVAYIMMRKVSSQASIAIQKSACIQLAREWINSLRGSNKNRLMFHIVFVAAFIITDLIMHNMISPVRFILFNLLITSVLYYSVVKKVIKSSGTYTLINNLLRKVTR